MSWRSIGNPVPVIAHAPSGFLFVLSYAAFNRDGIALELFDDREHVVSDGRRLRALRVRVHREDRVAMPLGEVEQRTPQQRTTPPSRPRMSSRCRIRYIVMSMSLRLRAVWRRPATSSPHARDDQAIEIEEEVLARAVVRGAAHLVLRDRVERRAERVRVVGRDDAAVGEHDEMRVVNRHERRQQQRLRVFEVLVQHVRDVLRCELHQPKYTGCPDYNLAHETQSAC